MGKMMLNGNEYAGSGGGGSLQTLLWNGDLTVTNSEITLSDIILNYDQIQIIYGLHAADNEYYHKSIILPTETIVIGKVSTIADSMYYTNANYTVFSGGFPASNKFRLDEIYKNGWGLHILAIYGIKFYGNSNSNRHDYSTVEKVVGTWIDGKPIYEKTYTNLSVSCSRDTYTHSGITISDIDSVVQVPVAIDSNKQSVGLEIGIYTSNKELALYVTSNPVTLVSFTIQYTKTTD